MAPVRRLAAPLLLPLLLLASAGAAGTVMVQSVPVSPSAATPPVTLAAGAAGTTTLGGSATSADTDLGSLPPGPSEVLVVEGGGNAYDARLEHVSDSGFGVLDSLTVALDDGAVTRNQVVINLGILTQSTGTTLALPSGGSGNLSVVASGTKSGGGSDVLTMDLVLTPSGEAAPELRYRYVLTLT